MSGIPADHYTKFMLTVIAGALVWLCVQGAGRPPAAHAQPADARQEVVIVGVKLPNDHPLPVGIRYIGRGRNEVAGEPWPWQPIPIEK